MECTLVKLGQYSGSKTSIYSVYIEGEKKTLYDKFLEDNILNFKDELKDISGRLLTIGKVTGARENFFKINEGAPGDGVCALYDDPDTNLRLYCIRYGMSLLILGGGGYKPKTIRALQEDAKLEDENNIIKVLSKEITQRMKDKDLTFTPDYMDFEGELTFKLEL